MIAYTWRLLTVACALFVLASCGKGDGGSGATGPSSSCAPRVSRTSLSANAEGESLRVNVAARSGCPWTASNGVSWITISTTSGTGDGQVQVVVATNETLDSRAGTITVAGQEVTVTQDSRSLSGRWGVTGTGALRGLEFTVRNGDTVTRVRFTYSFPIPNNRVCDRTFTEDMMVPIVDRQFSVPFSSNGLSATLAVQFQSPVLATGTVSTQTFANSSCGAGPPFSGTIEGAEATFGRLD